MKQYFNFFFIVFLALAFQLRSRAQVCNMMIPTKSVAPYRLTIGCNKTSNLIFPNTIISIDKGSSVVLAQKAIGVENILQLKAGREGFAQTNLSVITKGGRFYSFLIDYESDPAIINTQILKDSSSGEPDIVLSDSKLSEDLLNSISGQIAGQKGFRRASTKNQKIKLSMNGIYIKENLMWFAFKIANGSLVNYTPKSVRFFLKDIRRYKRTALQETEIQALFNKRDSVISGKSVSNAVFCFNPFTIPKSQKLVVQLEEEHGGRFLELDLTYASLLNARLLR